MAIKVNSTGTTLKLRDDIKTTSTTSAASTPSKPASQPASRSTGSTGTLKFNPVTTQTPTNSVFDMGAFQQLLSKQETPQASNSDWTTPKMLARISEIMEYDPTKGQKMWNDFLTLQNNPTSKYYNPYASVTNRAVSKIAQYGIDVSGGITDEWIKKNEYLLGYLDYRGQSNTPSAPTKKSSTKQRAAYEYYQILQSEDYTKRAESQWRALQEEVSYWAKRSDLNLSDEEIMNRIDWSRYGDLTKMDENKATKPNEFNRAIGYSKDALSGVIWNARNGQDNGNLYFAMAASWLQKGNTYQENADIAAKLNAGNLETYSPYSVAMTMDDAGLYFGVSSFNQQWLNENRAKILNGNDETAKRFYNQVAEAEADTVKAEEQLASLKERIYKMIDNGQKPDAVLRTLNRLLNKSDYNLLKKMDDSIQTGGNLLKTTRAIDYRRADFEADIQKRCEARDAKQNGLELRKDLQKPQQTTEQAPSGAAETGKAPAQAPAETPAATPAANQTAITDADIAASKAKDQQVADAGAAIDSQMTDSQRNDWNNAGSVELDNTTDAVTQAANGDGDIVRQQYEQTVKDTARSVFDRKIATWKPVYEYESTKEQYEANTQRFAELTEKYGDPLNYTASGPEEDKEIILEDPEQGFDPSNPFHIVLAFDEDTKQYELWNLFDDRGNNLATLGDAFFGDFTGYNRAEVYKYVDQEIQKANAQAKDILTAMSVYDNGTKEEQAEIDELRTLYRQNEADRKYLSENEASYNEQKAELAQADADREVALKALEWSGGDSIDLDMADAVAEYMGQFWTRPQYEIPEFGKLASLRNMAETFGEELTREGESEKLHTALDTINQQLDNAYYVRDWLEENGYELPDDLAKNFRRYIRYMELEKAGYEYDTILTDVDPDTFKAAADVGREWAEKNEDWFNGWNARWAAPEEPDQFSALTQKGDYVIYENHLTEDEVNTYYYLLGKALQENGGDVEHNPEALLSVMKDANDFYNYLTDSSYGMLTRRQSESVTRSASNAVNSGFLGGAWANTSAIAITPLEGISNFVYAVDLFTKGEEAEYNEYNVLRNASAFKTATREETRNAINTAFENNETLKWVANIGYEILCNRGDSAMNALAFGWLNPLSGIFGEIAGAVPMGITAGMDAYGKALKNGATEEQALAVAGITLFAESVTEGITIGNIKEAFSTTGEISRESLKSFVKQWLTQTGRDEAIGETLTDVIENLADDLFVPQSENKQLVQEIMRLNPGMTEEQAKEQAYTEGIKNLVHTAFVSYLSSGLDVGVKAFNAGLSTIDYYRQETRRLQQQGNNVNIVDVINRDRQAKKAVKEMVAQAEFDEQRNAEERQIQQDMKPFNLGNETPQQEAAEVNEARQDQQAAQDADNAAEAVGDTQTGELMPSTAPAEEASEQEAGTAVPVTEGQSRAANFVALLEKSKNADASSQTATLAGVIADTTAGEEGREVAQATASRLRGMFGENAVSMVQQLMVGAETSGSTVSTKTMSFALQYAALGNGECARVINSDEFRNANPIDKANMLVKAFFADSMNEGLNTQMKAAVQEFRQTREMTKLASQGFFDDVKAAQAKADQATDDAQRSQQALETQQGVEQAAGENVRKAGEAVAQNPSKENTDNLLHTTAVAESQAKVTQEYEQGAEKTAKEADEAQAEADAIAKDTYAKANEIANANIAEQDQQRAEAKAEEERVAKEQQAEAERLQAEEDERTGKAQEDRDNAAIDQAVADENLEANEAEDQKEKLREQAEKVKIRLRDLSKPVSGTEGMLALAAFERKLGTKINLEDMGPITPDGWTRGKYSYNNETGEASITLNKNMTLGQALVEAALHEITHNMRKTNAYNTYRNVVLKSIFKESGDINSLYENNADFRAKIDWTIEERKTAKDPNFVGKTHEQQIAAAEDEIVADFARMNLAEKDVIQRFMDAGMGGRMRNALHNINQALKNYLSNMSSEERRQAEYFRRAERAFQKAMDEVSRKAVHPEGEQFSIMQIAQATGMTFNENTLQLFDKDGNEIDGVNRQITPDMIADTPVGLLIRNGLSDQSPGVDENGNQIDSPQAAASKMMAGLMNMVARYKDSNLVWEIGATTLSSTFSALKSNSDPQYKTTVDFGTVCAKTQAIIDTLSQVMLDRVKEGKYGGLTREDIMKVYDAVNQAGLSVPCPVCYVFSRWMGVPSLLGQMSQYQHDYVVADENGKIDKKATQEKVDSYIRTAEEKYGNAKAINNQKTKLQNKLVSLEEKRIALEKELRGQTSEEQKAATQKEIDSVLAQMTDLDNQLGEVSAYNWITQALCKKDKNGKFVVDDKFKLTPDEILFDLNRTGDFAGYEKNWRYRNTRGAGMGKAIMPYSGETIGDILYGVKKGGRQSTIKNPWLNMDSKAAAKQLREARARAIKQNLVGGQRLQSTSDFRPEWGLDYIMSFMELQAAGSKVQMYTKVAEAVDFFASVGADVNLSIMGKGQGWHVDENGQYVLDFSSITGMDYETAKSLKDKYNNVQMILVGMNDTHIRLAMANSDIDFIIPWHSSGNSKDVLAGLISAVGEKLDSSVDYTTTQTDMVKGTVKKYTDENGNKVEYSVPGEQTAEQKALWDARMKLLTKGGSALTEAERRTLLSNPITADLYKRFTQKGVDDDCYGVKLSKEQANQIFPYEYWDTSLTKDQADQNGKRFVDYCEAMGIVPRFSQFKDDPGYWKLLIDRPMYNNDGTYHQQSVIDVTNARIGDLNEAGQLENSDLPTQAQAKYAPKDPRNANYAKYTAAQQQAVENAEAMINDRYDDGSEGSYSVYGETGENLDSDGLLSIVGEFTESDLELMRRNGLDTTTEERASRLGNVSKTVGDVLVQTLMDEGSVSVERFKSMIDAEQYPALYQWFHNNYEKGSKKNQDITANALREFLQFDAEQISNGSESVVSGWKQLIVEHPDGIEPMPIDDTEIENGSISQRSNYVSSHLFDGGDSANVYNNDIQGDILIDKRTIEESFAYNKNQKQYNKDVPYSVLEKVLLNSKELLQNGVYIGSHINYADAHGKVHYIAAPVDVGGYYDVVLFAVHDKTETNQNYNERAYVTEVMVIDRKNAPSSLSTTEVESSGVTPSGISDVSISRMLKSVNSDRIRFFDKDSLNGNQVQLSTGGERTAADEAMLNQTLKNAGVLTQEDIDAYNEMTSRPLPAQRQFGHQTAQESDALHDNVKDYLYNHSAYTPDTNQDQINRSVGWVQSMASESDPDGYRSALNEVLSDRFDYRSADGQARMLTVMSMAALKADAGDESALADELRLADAYNKQGTDLGRQLQARKIFRLMTPVGRRMTLQSMAEDINNDYRNHGRDVEVHLSDWLLRAAEVAETEEDFERVQRAAEQELAEQMPATWQDKLRTWRMLSMLANPRTHVRNYIGNLLFVPTVKLKNLIGTALESVGEKHGVFGYSLDEKTKAARYTDDAKAFAAQDVIDMKDILTGEAKYEQESRIARDQKAFGQGNGILSRTIGRGVQALSDFNSWALEKEDWLFLNRHYQNAMASYMTANGLSSSDMTGEKLTKAREYAVLEAQKATYRDANVISDWLNKSRSKGAQAFIDAVVPFKKTPANILRRGIEYSPIGLVRTIATARKSMNEYYSWVGNGQNGDMPAGAKSATQVLDGLASGLTGTAIAGLGAFLASIGAVKMKLNDDDDELEKERGSQEYSIELFGISVTADWAAPVCMPFFTGAALYQAAQDSAGSDLNLSAVEDALFQISDPVFNLSMLDGVGSLLKSISGNGVQAIGKLLEKTGANYISSLFPSAGGALARTIDTTRRKAYTESGSNAFDMVFEQIQNKIPYLSMMNIPYRNAYGDPEESGRFEAFMENFLLPGYVSQLSTDKLTEELQRVYDATLDKGVIPQYADKTLKVNGQDVRLNDKQYDQYAVSRGQMAKTLLNELIERPEFIALTETNPEAQAKIIKEIWSYAKQYGRHDVFPEAGFSEKWMQTAYDTGKVIDTILDKEEAKAQDSYAKEHKVELFKSIDEQNPDAIATHLEGMKQAGKTDKQIKDALTRQYKSKFQQAVIEDDWETAEAIRYGLMYMDLGESSYDDKTFDRWEDDAWKKYDAKMEAQENGDYDEYNDSIGQYGRGNIDLNNRQVVNNSDGSISTERSLSFYDEDTGKEILIPTVINGRVVSDDEAIDHYYETGEYLGMFDTPDEADEYAEQLHNRQDWYYNR